MFTGLWLRICFGSGRQQQTVTITAPGNTDVQFAPTPSHDYQHPYATLLAFSRPNSSFCRSFPEYAQSSSVVPPCSNLEIDQVCLTNQDNAQCWCRPHHTRVSTRRAIVGVGSLAKSRANSTVRCFPSPRHLIPRQNPLSEMPRPQHASLVQAPPQHYQVPQQYAGSSNIHAPVQPPAPKRKPVLSGPRIFHYSKCTGRKKALCVRVLGNSRSYPCVGFYADERCVLLRLESITRGWPGN